MYTAQDQHVHIVHSPFLKGEGIMMVIDLQTLTPPAEELFHDNHEGGHLTEDEYPMAHGLELDQHAIQHLKLP